MDERVAEGIGLFNGGKYFEAHEALEEVWLKAQGKEKTLLHGLIQIAAAFHHYTRGNINGFASLLGKGEEKLEASRADDCNVDLARLIPEILLWREYALALARGEPGEPPPPPVI